MPRHSWTEEDNIIALDAYLSMKDGVSQTDAGKRGVKLINRRYLRDQKQGDPDPCLRFMNKKIGNVMYLDGKGGYFGASKCLERIFAEYRNAPDKLAKRMAEIIATLPKEEK